MERVSLEALLHPLADRAERGGHLGGIGTAVWAHFPEITGSIHSPRRRPSKDYPLCCFASCSPPWRTEPGAAGILAVSVPPACAMSGRPPPLPPTCCAT